MHRAVFYLILALSLVFALAERPAQSQLFAPQIRPATCDEDLFVASATYSNLSLILTSQQDVGEWTSYAGAVIAKNQHIAPLIKAKTLTFLIHNDSATNGRYQVITLSAEAKQKHHIMLVASGNLTQPGSDTYVHADFSRPGLPVSAILVVFEHLPKAGPGSITLSNFHLNGHSLGYDLSGPDPGCAALVHL